MYKTIFLRGEGKLCFLSRQYVSLMRPATPEMGPAKRRLTNQSLVELMAKSVLP